MSKLAFIILSCVLISSAQASRTLLQVGGNCESAYGRTQKNNIFLRPMTGLRSLMQKNWNTVTLYDSDSAGFSTEMKLQGQADLPPSSVKNSTADQFFAELDRLIEETKKQSPAENQILIWMNSHGLSQKICISENETIAYDDSRLTSRLEKLKAHARLGFVNEACFGGSSIVPLSRYGCVVSAQGENFFSYGAPVSDALLKSKEKTMSLADLYFSSLASSTLTSPQISGFRAGMKFSNSFQDQYLNQADSYTAVTDINEYRKRAADCCEVSENKSVHPTDQKTIQTMLTAGDEETMRRYFEKPIKSQAKLESGFENWLKKAIPIKYEFDQLSGELKLLRFAQLKDPSRIYLKTEWILRDHGNEKIQKAVESALQKASVAAGMTQSKDYNYFLENGGELGRVMTPASPSERDWKKTGQIFFETLEAEVQKSGFTIEQAFRVKDPDYRKVEPFEVQGAQVAHAASISLNRKNRIAALEKSLDQLEKQSVSYQSDQPRIKDVNQLLARRYLQSRREQTVSAEEQALRDQCESFQLFAR